jgi:hypothetical protein
LTRGRIYAKSEEGINLCGYAAMKLWSGFAFCRQLGHCLLKGGA